MRHLGKPSAHVPQKSKMESKFTIGALFTAALFLLTPHYVGHNQSDKLTLGGNDDVMKRAFAFLRNTAKQKEDLSMTIITSNNDTRCDCHMVSTDCIDAVNCLPEQVASHRSVARGILLRRLMKKTAKNFEGEVAWPSVDQPIGKEFQYKTVMTWKRWVNENTLPLNHPPSPDYIFLNYTKLHKDCAEGKGRALVGFDCYFTAINEQEEFDTLETEAIPYLGELLEENQGMEQYYQRQIHNIQAAVSRGKGNEINALDHLRMMAHILRMLFNRKKPLRQLSSKTRVFNAHTNEEAREQSAVPPLRVSIHMRRADACIANGNLLVEASPLNSSAQQFNLRKCYSTSVYMDALRRLRDNVTKKDPMRRIEVFVSSDDASSLLDEISDNFPELYRLMAWHIIDVDRQRFNYKGIVEGRDHDSHGDLGDAALSDLWFLSNGEVFIGHLGSRFGKVAYLLATARYNRFIPFFSVDGHSLCCEIDEPCGEMKPYIKSMSDCLTFIHDLAGHPLNKDYFEVGSYVRMRLAQALPENESLDAEWVARDPEP